MVNTLELLKQERDKYQKIADDANNRVDFVNKQITNYRRGMIKKKLGQEYQSYLVKKINPSINRPIEYDSLYRLLDDYSNRKSDTYYVIYAVSNGEEISSAHVNLNELFGD